MVYKISYPALTLASMHFGRFDDTLCVPNPTLDGANRMQYAAYHSPIYKHFRVEAYENLPTILQPIQFLLHYSDYILHLC